MTVACVYCVVVETCLISGHHETRQHMVEGISLAPYLSLLAPCSVSI